MSTWNMSAWNPSGSLNRCDPGSATGPLRIVVGTVNLDHGAHQEEPAFAFNFRSDRFDQATSRNPIRASAGIRVESERRYTMG